MAGPASKATVLGWRDWVGKRRDRRLPDGLDAVRLVAAVARYLAQRCPASSTSAELARVISAMSSRRYIDLKMVFMSSSTAFQRRW